MAAAARQCKTSTWLADSGKTIGALVLRTCGGWNSPPRCLKQTVTMPTNVMFLHKTSLFPNELNRESTPIFVE